MIFLIGTSESSLLLSCIRPYLRLTWVYICHQLHFPHRITSAPISHTCVKVAGKCIPIRARAGARGYLCWGVAAPVVGGQLALSASLLMVASAHCTLCVHLQVPHWACAFIGLLSSCLTPWFPYHVTNNGPLLATEPTTSQNTRPESKKREGQSFPSAKTQGRN